MITNELAAILLRYPGLPVQICTKHSIEPIHAVELDCFEVEEGQVVVLVTQEAGGEG